MTTTEKAEGSLLKTSNKITSNKLVQRYIFDYRQKDIPQEETRDLMYKTVEANKAGRKLFHPNVESFVLALTPDSYCLVQGCCASIKSFVPSYEDGLRSFYIVVPVISTHMSRKKMVTYLDELNEIFGFQHFTELPEYKSIKDIKINPSFTESFLRNYQTAYPYNLLILHPIMVVKCSFKSLSYHTLQNLLALDFIRSMYMMHCLNKPKNVSDITDGTRVYNQPRLYFRLRKYFPELPKFYTLFLSFVLHGTIAGGTYVPWFMFDAGINKNAQNLNERFTYINEFFSTGYSQRSGVKQVAVPVFKPESTVLEILETKPAAKNTSSNGEDQITKLRQTLFDWFISDDVENYKKIIAVIAVTNNDDVLKAIL